MIERQVFTWLFLAILLMPLPSRAFSDPSTFSRPPLAAGGGERHFTGSPADGYSCAVCHQGGPAPALTVTGLPLEGFSPSTSYEIVVSWDPAVEKLAAALELTDEYGHAAGELRLPPDGEIEAPEFCEPASDGILAASLSELGDGRQVVHVPDCGSRRVRLLWTAPGTSTPVWFSGSAVWSDGEADAYHDGVADYGRVLSPSGPAAIWRTTNCSLGVSGPKTRASSRLAPLAFGAGLLWFRRRKRRAPQ